MTTQRLVRFQFWVDPCFDQIIDASGCFERIVLGYDTPAAEADRILSTVRYLHVSAAKDEVPKQWYVTADLLARCPALLAVSSAGAGYDTIDVEACTRAGVAVLNQAGGNANAVAELAFGLMLAVGRRMALSDRLLRAGTVVSRESLMGYELSGRTLGLVGFGHIGKRMVPIAQALGMRVLAVDPYLSDDVFREAGVERTTFPDLLRQSDVVSLHCPRNAETLGMMDAQAFSAMRQGAWFISTARGGIHDEAALYAALSSGHLGGAGLDVWSQEPPAADHPLLSLDNVVGTFHAGGVTHEGRRNIAAIAAHQWVGLARGQRPPRMLNPEVWDIVAQRLAGA